MAPPERILMVEAHLQADRIVVALQLIKGDVHRLPTVIAIVVRSEVCSMWFY